MHSLSFLGRGNVLMYQALRIDILLYRKCVSLGYFNSNSSIFGEHTQNNKLLPGLLWRRLLHFYGNCFSILSKYIVSSNRTGNWGKPGDQRDVGLFIDLSCSLCLLRGSKQKTRAQFLQQKHLETKTPRTSNTIKEMSRRGRRRGKRFHDAKTFK